MKWKITVTDSGAYRLTPKNGELYNYALATSSSSATNGARLMQGEYWNNNSYCDEWIISAFTATFYGVTNAGHDHYDSLFTIANHMKEKGCTNVLLRDGAISPNVCKEELQNTNIFTSRSHGGKFVDTNGNLYFTFILLNDPREDDDVQYCFLSHTWTVMPSNYAGITASDDYSSIDIALFIGCKTAFGGIGARNLPTAIVEQGARAAIGFTESIDCDEANLWTEFFYSKLLQGATIKDAKDFACDHFPENSKIQSAVICGDATICFPWEF